MCVLRVARKEGIVVVSKKEKLESRLIGTLEVVERIRVMDYQLAFPSQSSLVQVVFHVLMSRKYYSDPRYVKSMAVVEDATYEEKKMQMLDRKEQVLRRKVIPLVKSGGSIMVWKSPLESGSIDLEVLS